MKDNMMFYSGTVLARRIGGREVTLVKAVKSLTGKTGLPDLTFWEATGNLSWQISTSQDFAPPIYSFYFQLESCLFILSQMSKFAHDFGCSRRVRGDVILNNMRHVAGPLGYIKGTIWKVTNTDETFHLNINAREKIAERNSDTANH